MSETKFIRATLVFEIPKDKLKEGEEKLLETDLDLLRRDVAENSPNGVRATLTMSEVNDTAPMPVDEAQLLKELDALFVRYQSANRVATWGGSFEKEAGGRQELRALVNPMFDTLLKLLRLRNPEVPRI